MRIFFFFLTKQTNVKTVIDFLFISYLFVNFQSSKIQVETIGVRFKVETIGNANANSKKLFLFLGKEYYRFTEVHSKVSQRTLK